ncbi:MAG: methylated-DNA--[protein]-cysteine S-methyltransferase [Piscinibacter sp.]|uniref:methylated-DNA--[protein]-cysteine S-methyltransferase n=1 Tax=Piscinibacter sp. TaxID=1903157 RepID=UPI003D09C56A
MSTLGHALFDTPIGSCGVAWSEAGITDLLLPGADPSRTRAALRRRAPQSAEMAPPPEVRAALVAVRALLGGQVRDLADIVLDLRGAPAFHQRVYEAARRLRPGQTCTYGELAEAVGEAGAARAVGQALGANPCAVIVPCHRVLAARGASGGFSAPGGVATKLRLLEIERARFGSQPSLFEAGS